MKIARRRGPRPHIDMTPLIDTIFTLLIVLMLVATFQSASMIQLALPQAATKDPDQTPEIMISVDEHGTCYVNSEQVAIDQLETFLKPLIARSKDRVVTFRGDKKIPYDWFVKVLDAARSSGAVHIDVVKENP